MWAQDYADEGITARICDWRNGVQGSVCTAAILSPSCPLWAFKRQVAQEFIAGEGLYALSKRHDISRQLIRVWVERYEAGALDEDAQAADLLQEYEAKIAALERMVGLQALEIRSSPVRPTGAGTEGALECRDFGMSGPPKRFRAEQSRP